MSWRDIVGSGVTKGGIAENIPGYVRDSTQQEIRTSLGIQSVGKKFEDANVSRLQEGSPSSPSREGGYKIYYGRNIVEGVTLNAMAKTFFKMNDGGNPFRLAADPSTYYRPFTGYTAGERYWESGHDPRRPVPGYIKLWDNGREFYDVDVPEITASNYKTYDPSNDTSRYWFLSPRQLWCSRHNPSSVQLEATDNVNISRPDGTTVISQHKWARWGLSESVKWTNTWTGLVGDHVGYTVDFELASRNSGGNRDFLYVLQIFGYGPIDRVQFCTVNSQNWANKGFNHCLLFQNYQTDSYKLAVTNNKTTETSTDVVPGGFKESDTLDGLFTGFYVFQYNKENRNYSGEPRVVLYINGHSSIPEVELVSGVYRLKGTTEYSNNPARCLLEYLLNPNYGLGLQPRDLDLKTFYEAQQKCERIVKTNATIQGRAYGLEGLERSADLDFEYIYAQHGRTGSPDDPDNTWGYDRPAATSAWKDEPPDPEAAGYDTTKPIWWQSYRKLEGVPAPNAGVVDLWSRKAKVQDQRNVPRYECNLALDSANSNVKNNIDEILKCMFGANLIWSEGKYKLTYEEPLNLAEQTSRIRATITDEDILNDNIKWEWPNAQDRLNRVTLSFTNDHKNFLQDEVSWPELNSSQYREMFDLDRQPLHETLNVQGVTDPYHAKDYAETRVRASRDKQELSMSVSKRWLTLEPGDLIRVDSEYLDLDDVFRIEEIKVKEDYSIDLRLFHFDWTWGRWSSTDDIYQEPQSRYGFSLPRPQNVTFTANPLDSSTGAGRLVWEYSADQTVDVYQVFIQRDSGTRTFLSETPGLSLDIPPLVPGVYRFYVRPRTVLGRLGLMGQSSVVNLALGSTTSLTLTSQQVKKDDGTLALFVTGAWSGSSSLYEWEISKGAWKDKGITSDTSVQVEVPELGEYTFRVRFYYRLNGETHQGAWRSGMVTLARTGVTVTTPRVLSSQANGDLLRVVYTSPDKDLQGMELRYSRGRSDSTAPLPALADATWTTGSRLDSVTTVNNDLPSIVTAGWESNGRYRIFGRTVNRYGDYSPTVEVGYHLLARPVSSETSQAEGPLFSGAMNKLYLYEGSNSLYYDGESGTLSKAQWDDVPFRTYAKPSTYTSRDTEEPWYQTTVYDIGSLLTSQVFCDVDSALLTGGSLTYEVYFEHSTDNATFTRSSLLTDYAEFTFRYYRWRVYMTGMVKAKIDQITHYTRVLA